MYSRTTSRVLQDSDMGVHCGGAGSLCLMVRGIGKVVLTLVQGLRVALNAYLLELRWMLKIFVGVWYVQGKLIRLEG